MKALLLLELLAAITLAAAGPPSLASTIRASKWKKRVLLVAAPRASEAAFRQQKQLLAPAGSQLGERDLLVLDVLHDHLAPADRQYLRHDLGLHLTGFEVVLIGKDGGVKQRSTQPLAPAALFGTIDQMPMRRQEMRQGH
ncbi:MAG: DUF4174 domain-containing protein [Janthinobacterium lividum]